MTEKHEHKKKHDKKHEKVKELTETLQRVHADFENYKKQIEKQQQEFTRYSNARLVSQLLPVLDNFEACIKNSHADNEFAKGVKIAYNELMNVLRAEGIKEIKTIGNVFDPYKHEVLLQEESDKPEGTVLEELQKGYMINDKVLRHAKVKIAKKKGGKK